MPLPWVPRLSALPRRPARHRASGWPSSGRPWRRCRRRRRNPRRASKSWPHGRPSAPRRGTSWHRACNRRTWKDPGQACRRRAQRSARRASPPSALPPWGRALPWVPLPWGPLLSALPRRPARRRASGWPSSGRPWRRCRRQRRSPRRVSRSWPHGRPSAPRPGTSWRRACSRRTWTGPEQACRRRAA